MLPLTATDLAFLTCRHSSQQNAVPCANVQYRSRTEEVGGSNPLTSTSQQPGHRPGGSLPPGRVLPEALPGGEALPWQQSGSNRERFANHCSKGGQEALLSSGGRLTARGRSGLSRGGHRV